MSILRRKGSRSLRTGSIVAAIVAVPLLLSAQGVRAQAWGAAPLGGGAYQPPPPPPPPPPKPMSLVPDYPPVHSAPQPQPCAAAPNAAGSADDPGRPRQEGGCETGREGRPALDAGPQAEAPTYAATPARPPPLAAGPASAPSPAPSKPAGVPWTWVALIAFGGVAIGALARRRRR